MIITTAKVDNGVIHVDSQDLPNGTTVTLLARQGDETFELDGTEESQLLAAITEAERGEMITAERVLEQLREL